MYSYNWKRLICSILGKRLVYTWKITIFRLSGAVVTGHILDDAAIGAEVTVVGDTITIDLFSPDPSSTLLK